METRETKDAIDTIKNKSRNMSVNMAIIKNATEAELELLIEINKKLDRLVVLLEEAERRRLVSK